MTTTTPDMTLVLPDVSITAGPQWANLLNTAFTRIDAHDHSPGNGVLITPSGLNISADLSFVQNNATNLRSVRLFANNAFTPGASDRTCLYALGGELYYIDAAGNNVQITLNGTIDAANAITSLSIKDSGFFIQYFGDTSRQFRFNVSAIPASTTRILSVPDSGSNDTFVTQAATQTLTNKTLTAPVISTPTITTSANLATVAAPIAPAAGTANVYVSSVDGQLHLQNSAGVDTAIGAGSSSGKNYLQSYYGFTLSPLTGAAVNLTATGNRTATQTVFGTSSATAATLITYNTATPLRAPGDLQITFPAAASGAFVESPMFTLDAIDVNTPTQFISFESSFLTSGAVAGDITVQIVQYDATGNYVGVVTPSTTSIPTQYAKFKAAWNPSTTATAKYSIRFVVNTASARTLDIQDIVVGPQFVTTSDAISAWIPYTPTFSAGFGTVTNVVASYRRVGSSMEVVASCTPGTTVASLGYVTLPSTFTIDSSNTLNNTIGSAGPIVGLYGASGVVGGNSMVTATGTANNVVYIGGIGSGTSTLVPANGNVIGSPGTLVCRFTVPIAQWTATVNLAGNANIEYASNSSSADAADTSSFVYGSAGATGVIGTTNLTAGRRKRVRFQTPIQPTDRLVFEVNGGSGWFPLNSSNTAGLGPITFQNGASYGVGIDAVVNTTDVDVQFSQYYFPSGATYGAAGSNWTALTGYKWRLAKYSAVGLAELAPATTTSQGSISRECGWTPYTPTFTGLGTVSAITAFYKVVGDSLYVNANCTIGTISAAIASISLPSGFTINSAKVPNSAASTASTQCSIAGPYSAANANNSGQILLAPATSTSVVYIGGAVNSSGTLSPQTGTGVTASSTPLSFRFEVPLV